MSCIKDSQMGSQSQIIMRNNRLLMPGKSVELHWEGVGWHFSLVLSISDFVFMFFHAPVKYKMSP